MGGVIRDAVLFLSVTSLTTMMRRWGKSPAPGIGMPCEAPPCASTGWGSCRGAASGSRQRLSQCENEAGSDAPSPSPTEEAINSSRRTGARRLERSNSGSPDGCPMAEGPTSNSNRRTGPGTKGFINSVDPARAACGELGQIRSGSIPSWETLPESESSVRSYPGNRDRAPRFLWSETLVKPNNAVIVAAPAAAREGFWHPLRQLPKSVHQSRDLPATPATVPESGRARPAAEAPAFATSSACRRGRSGAR